MVMVRGTAFVLKDKDRKRVSNGFKRRILTGFKVVRSEFLSHNPIPLVLLYFSFIEGFVFVCCVHLFMSVGRLQELCKGGDLLTTYHFKSEQDAANIISKVTNAVRYMHDRNIAVSGAIIRP